MFKWSHQTIFLTLVGLASLMVYSVALFMGGYSAGQHVGYSVAEKKVAEVFPSSQEPVKVLNGVIRQLLPDGFVMEAQRVTANPLDDGPKIRTVVVSNDTVFRHIILKPPSELDAQALVYEQQLKQAQIAGTAAPSAPLPFNQFAIEFKDLTVGDRVEVRSTSDLRFASRLIAVELYRHGSTAQQ